MKHFNITQRRVLCPHNHLLKATTTTGGIRELSSPRLVQSASWRIRELSSYHGMYALTSGVDRAGILARPCRGGPRRLAWERGVGSTGGEVREGTSPLSRKKH